MRKIGILFMIILLSIFSVFSVNSAAKTGVISLDIKNIGHDDYTNTNKLSANVSVASPGRLTYVEEYYTVDGNSNPKYCCSGKYFDGQLIQSNGGSGSITYNASFDIFRPLPHKGVYYSLIKAIILLDDNRIYERWLTKNVTFIDNTGSGINTGTISNIEIYETREKILSDQPTTFAYTSLGTIYEINATGNGQTSLRVELLRDAPSNTHISKGVAYKYANIITDNYNLGQLNIRFKIENSWITNGSIKSLGLFNWDNINKIWNSLPTRQINKDNEYMYFESDISGISVSPMQIAIIGFVPKGTDIISNGTEINVGDNGEGVISTEPPSNIIKFESLISDIGQYPVTYSLSNPEFSIYQVIVTGKVNEKGIILRVEHLKNVSSLVGRIPPGDIYANENVYIESKKLNTTLVRFKVKNSWLADNNLSKENIQLLRYTNGWKRSPTNVTNVDNDYAYFEARTSGLSPFAISGLTLKNSIPMEASNTTIPATIPIETPRSVVVRETKSSPGFEIIPGIGIIMLYILIRRRK